jgi:hypothetical protein
MKPNELAFILSLTPEDRHVFDSYKDKVAIKQLLKRIKQKNDGLHTTSSLIMKLGREYIFGEDDDWDKDRFF